jgi:hypothetical protein
VEGEESDGRKAGFIGTAWRTDVERAMDAWGKEVMDDSRFDIKAWLRIPEIESVNEKNRTYRSSIWTRKYYQKERRRGGVRVNDARLRRPKRTGDVRAQLRLHLASFVSREIPALDVDFRELGVHEESADGEDLLFRFGREDELCGKGQGRRSTWYARWRVRCTRGRGEEQRYLASLLIGDAITFAASVEELTASTTEAGLEGFRGVV